MMKRRIRAPTRGDDWGCCPVKPVSPVQGENEASIHYKNLQAANKEDTEIRHGDVRAPWSDHISDNSSDPVTAAAAGLNAGDATCYKAPIYASAF